MTPEQQIEVIRAKADKKRLVARAKNTDLPWFVPPDDSDFNFDEFDYRRKPEPREFWIVTWKGGGPPSVFIEKPSRDEDTKEIIHVLEVL